MHLEDHLLEAVGAGLARLEHLDPPALPLCVAAVHPEQVGGEDRRLVAAGAGADLHDDVALVVGVGGHQQRAQPLVRLLLHGALRGLLLCRHGDDLGVALVVLQLLGLGGGLVGAPPRAAGLHHLAQPGLLLGEALDAVEVAVGVGLGEQGPDLVEALLERAQTIVDGGHGREG